VTADADALAVRLARGPHDRRSPEEFAAALERETARSLREDPSRWPWKRSEDTPDRHRTTRHQVEAS
jgi:hypothetical protein